MVKISAIPILSLPVYFFRFKIAAFCGRLLAEINPCPIMKALPQSPPPRSKKRKTWKEKLQNDHDLPKVIRMEGKLQDRFGKGTMAIPAPREVDARMKKVPPGKLITIDTIRNHLATKHGTTTACGITTGIFAWIAAHAADEARTEGADEEKITPYWRTLKVGGELNAKYPGGIDALKARLEAEGHEVFQKGKRWLVRDYEQSVVRS